MSSWVYVIGPESGNGPVKIGYAQQPEKRLGELQTGHPEQLVVLARFRSDDARTLERRIHKDLDDKRTRPRGEWFDLGPNPVNVVAGLISSYSSVRQSVAREEARTVLGRQQAFETPSSMLTHGVYTVVRDLTENDIVAETDPVSGKPLRVPDGLGGGGFTKWQLNIPMLSGGRYFTLKFKGGELNSLVRAMKDSGLSPGQLLMAGSVLHVNYGHCHRVVLP